MSQTMLWVAAALVGELVLLLLVLLTLSWLRTRAARRRDVKAMQALVGRIRKSQPQREAALAEFLENNYGLEGEALSAATAGLWGSELKMLQRFIGVYGSRDAAAAAQFDADLAVATEPYLALSGAVTVEENRADEPGVDPAELDALRAENKRLSDELRITMETMSRMLKEYSTMFSGAPAYEAAPIQPPAANPVPAAVDAVPEVAAVVADDEEPATGPPVVPDDDVSVVLDDEGLLDGPAVPPAQDAGEPDRSAGAAAPFDRDANAGIEEVVTDAPVMAEDHSEGDDGSGDAGGPIEDLTTVGDTTQEEDAEIGVVMDPAVEPQRLPAEQPPTGTDAASDTKGADLEAISELLIEGDSALLQPDGSDGDQAGQTASLSDADAELMVPTDGPGPEAASQTSPTREEDGREQSVVESVDLAGDRRDVPVPTAVSEPDEDIEDLLAGGADHRFGEPVSDSDAVSDGKAAGLDDVSERSIEDASASGNQDEGGADKSEQASSLFDADDGLFDPAFEDSVDGAAESPSAGDDIEDLFDADEAFTDPREKVGKP
ncbi:MAG: hypothetical protein PVF93_03740 [Chromatiaceae bacterium]